MGLARKLYFLLADILHTVHDLEAGTSLLQTDRAMSARFGISESTARNWRRGTTTNVSPNVINHILQICGQIAPDRAPDIELVGRLSRDIREIGLAANALADELESQISQNGRDWHIYSGPLLLAFDPEANAEFLRTLMARSSMIVERFLEMRADSADIPSIAEMIRYSIHGWHAVGLFRIREASLTNMLAEIKARSIGKVETALYIGDGLGNTSFLLGKVDQAKRYVQQALGLLDGTSRVEAQNGPVSVEDAQVLLRSFETSIMCHEGYALNYHSIRDFVQNYKNVSAENEWAEGLRHKAFGYISICQDDFDQGAYHFERGSLMQDRWLERFGVPFCTIAPHSLHGYALLMTQGPTDNVRLQMSEGLLKTLDHGGISEQVQARICLSLFFAAQGNQVLSDFHRQKALALVQQHGLSRWFDMLDTLLHPTDSRRSNLSQVQANA
jgi:hypothetical protein